MLDLVQRKISQRERARAGDQSGLQMEPACLFTRIGVEGRQCGCGKDPPGLCVASPKSWCGLFLHGKLLGGHLMVRGSSQRSYRKVRILWLLQNHRSKDKTRTLL